MRYRSRQMQKGLEKRQENLKAKLAELRMKINERKDDTVDFHSMGIDHILWTNRTCSRTSCFRHGTRG